jgi:hypothetical protein
VRLDEPLCSLYFENHWVGCRPPDPPLSEMRTCTASSDVMMPATHAGMTSWFEGMVRLSVDALINGQPLGY